jgi:signal transduction histidine kinase
VRERIEFWAALAEDTGRSVRHSIPAGPVLVQAGAPDLQAVFDAILGNIFAHTPAGVPFWVAFVRISDALVGVSIDDAGPGFFDLRAIRRGHSENASTGLGLDIARHTAEASGGYLLLGRSPQGGARVQLCFGLVRSPAPARGVSARW